MAELTEHGLSFTEAGVKLSATQLEANKILAELPDRIRTHRQRRKTAAFMPSRQAVGDVLADITGNIEEATTIGRKRGDRRGAPA